MSILGQLSVALATVSMLFQTQIGFAQVVPNANSEISMNSLVDQKHVGIILSGDTARNLHNLLGDRIAEDFEQVNPGYKLKARAATVKCTAIGFDSTTPQCIISIDKENNPNGKSCDNQKLLESLKLTQQKFYTQMNDNNKGFQATTGANSIDTGNCFGADGSLVCGLKLFFTNKTAMDAYFANPKNKTYNSAIVCGESQ